MPLLHQIVPDADVLLGLEPEELAGVILQAFRDVAGDGMVHPQSFNNNESFSPTGPYPREKKDQILSAISEALAWLESQVLTVRVEGSNGQSGWRRLSRRGARVAAEGNWENFLSASTLPQRLIHPKILEKTLFEFMRGSYDAAVFQALKTVEVKVRESTPTLDKKLLGTHLMRAAFHVSNGPLTDMAASEAEREAVQHLFAGAIGAYKNPTSHRSVEIGASEAAEIVILASHLLKIVDARTGRTPVS